MSLIRRLSVVLCAMLWVCAAARAGGLAPLIGGLILDLEPDNNTLPNARSIPLVPSGVLMGILSLTPGDVDIFYVYIPGGLALTVTTSPLSGPVNAPFTSPDTVVSILSINGGVLVEGDDGGDDFPTNGLTRGSVVRYRSPADALYAVRVKGFDGSESGEYLLMISLTGAPLGNLTEVEPNNSPAQAHLLGMPWSGPLFGFLNLVPPGDVDFLSVDMYQGQVLTVTTTPIAQADDFQTPDTVLSVITSNGVTVLVENDDDTDGLMRGGGGPLGSTIRMIANHTGRFYIKVRGFDGGTMGRYGVTACVAPRSLDLCSGDLNADGVVNSSDLALLLAVWGACP